MSRLDWGQLLKPAVLIALIGILAVFLHSGLAGEDGLGALRDAEAQETELQLELERLRAERAALANRVARLDRSHLDLELLDERIRAVLGRAREEELIIR